MSTKPSKRVMGQGSVYQRPAGLWAAQILVDGQRRSVSARTQQECVAKLDALKAQAKAGLPVMDQRGTVSAYLGRWLTSVASRVKPRTMRHYAYMVELISGEIGRLKLARVSPGDVEGMLSRLQEQGLSAQTASHARAALRTALRDAERLGMVTRNSAQIAKPPTVPHQPPRMLTPSEAQAVLDALPDPGLHRIATVAVHSGLRQGELLGLRWQDVDPDGGDLHVRKALQRLGGTYQLVGVKSRSSRRTVPLTAVAAEALQAEHLVQLKARQDCRTWHEPIAGLCFTTTTGQPRSGSAITHQFADALATAGLPAMHFHHLRHAYAGLMLASGSDLSTVSSLLGHSSIALTSSTYAGVAPSLKRQAAERLGRMLRQPV